jgi:hypothetical protein
MFKNLFTKKSVIDESTRQWIFDTFAWAIENFNVQVFQKETRLVLPTNEFYSGRVGSVEEMAKNIFDHTLNYSGMKNWPLTLVSPDQSVTNELPVLSIQHALRGENAVVAVADTVDESSQTINFTFNPSQLNQPQDLIASYVQQLATVLVLQQKTLPPGGQEFLPQAIDLLACVMGFGIVFANTAYQFKGGCGSCYNPRANRQAALPENEMLYCLAVFSQLKGIKNKNVLPHLKGHLRKEYKKMVNDIETFFNGTNDHPVLLFKPSE